MLPETITTQTVREASDEVHESWLEAIDACTDRYFDEIVDILARKHNLTDEQIEELEERLCWNVELLPKQS